MVRALIQRVKLFGGKMVAMRRAGIIVAVWVVMASACSGHLVRHVEGSPTPVPTKVVGEAFATFDPQSTVLPTTPSPTSTPQPPSFVLRVSDEDNDHPRGIPVAISGPVRRTLTTDDKGYVSAHVPPGFYDVKIPTGCADEVYVHKGGTAHIGVVDGNTVRGTLLLIWQHRFGPAPPVSADVAGDWPVGKTVNVSFALQDHCSQHLAPNKAFSNYGYRYSDELRLVGAPVLHSDATGRAKVAVSCVKAGSFDLDMYDRDQPSESIDLVQLAAGFSGVPTCSND